MSEVVPLDSRRKPVCYSVEIEHYSNGKITVFLDGISETEHNRRKVSQILRHAADMLIEPPESNP